MPSPWYNPLALEPGLRAMAERLNDEFNKIAQAFAQLPAPSAIGVGQGQPNYTWFAWSDSADGTSNFSTASPGTRSYIGVAANRSVATPSQFPVDYVWTRIKGTAGSNAPQVILQYSADGANYWHVGYQAGDKYWRQSVDGGVTYSSASRLSAASLAELDSFANSKLSAAGSDIVMLKSRMSSAEASVIQEASTRASADAATAATLTVIQTTLNGHTTSITQYATSINGINAKYGVTIDVDGKITGIQLIGGGGQSDFIVKADRFAIESGTDKPFEVIGGVTYIKKAKIAAYAIDTARLENNATFSAGMFYADFAGFRRTPITYSVWLDVQDAFGTAAQFSITTGADGQQRTMIDAVLTLARDGGDDDNTSWRVIRSDGLVLPQTYTNVQIASGRRQYSFAFYDDVPAASQTYTYKLQFMALPSDGTPYFYNVSLRGVVFKK